MNGFIEVSLTMEYGKRVLLIAVLILCTACSHAGIGTKVTSEPTTREKVSSPLSSNKNPIRIAKALIYQRDYRLAYKLLNKIAERTPRGWKAFREDREAIHAAFDSKEEFILFVAHHLKGKNAKKAVFWDELSYSSAWYLLGFLEVERRNLEQALPFFDKALVLDPGNPSFLSEKALVLALLGKHKESYKVALEATRSRPWASDRQRARAFRGVGFALIELKRFDEAESAYRTALKLEPNSPVTLKEMRYLEKAKKKMGIRQASLPSSPIPTL